MAGSGFRIAQAYVQVTLRRDELPGELDALAAELSAESDAIGEEAGQRIGRGIGRGIGDAPVTEPATRKGTEAGGRFGDAFTSRMRAALSSLPPVGVPLDDADAQLKLDYLREELRTLSDQRIGIDISETDALAKLTYLRGQLDDLRAMSPSVQVKADTAAASAQIDKFFAETQAKAEVAGDDAGKKLGDGMAKSAGGASPLIVGAIAGGLIAGGPAISAASVLMFGGLAAVAASNVGSVQDAFSQLKAYVLNDVQVMAEQSAGEFVTMAGDIRRGFNQIEPDIRSAMAAGAVDIHLVVDALVQAADTAIPAFNRALQQGQPVVQGLDALIRDLGSGVAGMMDAITAHSGAEGQVLSDLGQTLNILLPMIGELLGQGAELGQTVLPVLNTGLRITSDVLHLLAPILPEIAAGFAAFRVVSMLSGPLGSLSSSLQKAGADADGLGGKLANLGASGASGLAKSLPIIGIALAGVSAAFTAQSQDVQRWGQALLDGGAKAEQAQQEISHLQGTAYMLSHGMQGGIADLLGYGTALNVTAQSGQKAQQTARDLYNAMSPLEQKQQDVTKATNDLQLAVQKYGPNSDQAAAASGRLSAAQAALSGLQDQVKTATQNASNAQQDNATRLQDIANKASAASTQINLLKGALDALTGKQVTETEAEIGVTQATQAATTAVQGHTGALVDNAGKLTVATDRGAAAQQALIQLAGASNQLIATMQQQGATDTDVAAKDAELRQNFINTAQQMGYSASQAQDLANKLYGIPTDRHTDITLGLPNYGAVDSSINWVARDRTANIYTVNHVTNAVQAPQAIGGIAVPMAAGGVIVPMAAGGQADIFEPNNPTFLIGDNKKVRESFIPQDGSPRSKAILTETASEMGYRLTPTTGTGEPNSGGGDTYTYNVTLNVNALDLTNSMQLSRRLLEAFQEGLQKLEASRR